MVELETTRLPAVKGSMSFTVILTMTGSMAARGNDYLIGGPGANTYSYSWLPWPANTSQPPLGCDTILNDGTGGADTLDLRAFHVADYAPAKSVY